MTHIYCVRHAQPLHTCKDDRTRPLSADGIIDSEKVVECLKHIHIDYFISSPYKRSIDTIKNLANSRNMIINTDERFRERKKGFDGNNYGMFRKRWSNLDFHEDGGESIHMVQNRNIEALFNLLKNHQDENVVLATHGTALSSILNYFNSDFGCDNFLRIIDFMPYIIRLDFEGTNFTGNEELLIIEKVFEGIRADKR